MPPAIRSRNSVVLVSRCIPLSHQYSLWFEKLTHKFRQHRILFIAFTAHKDNIAGDKSPPVFIEFQDFGITLSAVHSRNSVVLESHLMLLSYQHTLRSKERINFAHTEFCSSLLALTEIISPGKRPPVHGLWDDASRCSFEEFGRSWILLDAAFLLTSAAI